MVQDPNQLMFHYSTEVTFLRQMIIFWQDYPYTNDETRREALAHWAQWFVVSHRLVFEKPDKFDIISIDDRERKEVAALAIEINSVVVDILASIAGMDVQPDMFKIRQIALKLEKYLSVPFGGMKY